MNLENYNVTWCFQIEQDTSLEEALETVMDEEFDKLDVKDSLPATFSPAQSEPCKPAKANVIEVMDDTDVAPQSISTSKSSDHGAKTSLGSTSSQRSSDEAAKAVHGGEHAELEHKHVDGNDGNAGVSTKCQDSHFQCQESDQLSSLWKLVISHPEFEQFCEWCSTSQDTFKEGTVNYDRELERWFAFVRTRNLELSGKLKEHHDLIQAKASTHLDGICQNPVHHARYLAFKFDFEKSDKTHDHRHPFCSLKHVEEDSQRFRKWLHDDIARTAQLREQLKRVMSHCLWTSYVVHCCNEGADKSSYASLDAVMEEGDPDATMEDWTEWLRGQDWVKQD